MTTKIMSFLDSEFFQGTVSTKVTWENEVISINDAAGVRRLKSFLDKGDGTTCFRGLFVKTENGRNEAVDFTPTFRMKPNPLLLDLNVESPISSKDFDEIIEGYFHYSKEVNLEGKLYLLKGEAKAIEQGDFEPDQIKVLLESAVISKGDIGLDLFPGINSVVKDESGKSLVLPLVEALKMPDGGNISAPEWMLSSSMSTLRTFMSGSSGVSGVENPAKNADVPRPRGKPRMI